eukprot:6180676-Pleurochrysis_carterae.AAC.1
MSPSPGHEHLRVAFVLFAVMMGNKAVKQIAHPTPAGRLQRLQDGVRGSYAAPYMSDSITSPPNLNAWRGNSSVNTQIRHLLKVHFVSSMEGCLFE